MTMCSCEAVLILLSIRSLVERDDELSIALSVKTVSYSLQSIINNNE